MRVFLIFFSFLNALLYFMLYAFYDSIIILIGGLSAPEWFLLFLKILILIIFGFLIGLVVSLMLKINRKETHFDYRTAITVGIFPFIFLILSNNSIINFISIHIFNSSRQISELLFYFLSRQIIFAVWLGFAIGVSVQISFKKKLKHEIVYNLEKESS